MHSEDRLIHFSTELFYAPSMPKVPELQKLYYELSRTRASYDNTDFSAPGQYRFHSKRGSNTQSMVLFLQDRLVLIEEWADIALADFFDKVREVTARALEILKLEAIVAQTATLRSTFALTHFTDARIFLMDHACGQEHRIAPHFRRPIAVGGIRYVLPETPDHPGALTTVIESFTHNPKEVFVEVKGVFGNQRIDGQNLSVAISNIKQVRSFITDSVFPYLNQYDEPVGERS